MIIRTGLVSNSSSTAFIIYNKSPFVKNLTDFAQENIHLLHEFNNKYNYDYKEEDFIASVQGITMNLVPGRNAVIFGDEDGTLIGHVFDYILRDGGYSESFSWQFEEYLR